MNWTDIKTKLAPFAPFLAGALDMAGPAGLVAGSLVSAALGVASTPQHVDSVLASDPEAYAKVRIAEINNANTVLTLHAQNANLQAAANVADAASHSRFLAGGRAFILWACALALGIQFPLTWGAEFVASLLGLHYVPPVFDSETLIKILFTLLGVAAWHVGDKLTEKTP